MPLDALYFLSVARSDPAKPYTLALAAEEASLLDADFMHRVGYDWLDDKGASRGASCWIERVYARVGPLAVISSPTPAGRRSQPLGMGRTTTTLQPYSGNPRRGRRAGAQRPFFRAGKPTITRYYTPSPWTALGAYRAYLCQ
jgi:hypothetical protein